MLRKSNVKNIILKLNISKIVVEVVVWNVWNTAEKYSLDIL